MRQAHREDRIHWLIYVTNNSKPDSLEEWVSEWMTPSPNSILSEPYFTTSFYRSHALVFWKKEKALTCIRQIVDTEKFAKKFEGLDAPPFAC